MARLQRRIEAEIAQTFDLLINLDLLPVGSEALMSERIALFPIDEGLSALSTPTSSLKLCLRQRWLKEAFQKLDIVLPTEAIVASTTSTFLADLVAGWSRRPEYVLNAHFLNPAFLVPLVEVSPHVGTKSSATNELKDLLEEIGKVPVLCKASPGYIVPRIKL